MSSPISILTDPSFPLQSSPEAHRETDALFTSDHSPLPERPMPDQYQSITRRFRDSKHDILVTVGWYEDGTPGQVIITLSHADPLATSFAQALADLLSWALQHGISFDQLKPILVGDNRISTDLVQTIFSWVTEMVRRPVSQSLDRQP